MEIGTSDQGCVNESDLQWGILGERLPPTEREGAAYHVRLAPGPGENLWALQLSLKNRLSIMVVLSLRTGAERRGLRGTPLEWSKVGASSMTVEGPVCGIWGQRAHCAPERGSRSSDPKQPSGSWPQPTAQEVCTGRPWARLESSEAVPDTQPGRAARALKTEKRPLSEPLFIPSFPHLFRTRGWIAWHGWRRWENCSGINPYPYCASGWMAWGNACHIWKTFP